MKILFINFNLGSTPGINNGLAILSAILKRRGHNVDLVFLCEALGYGFDLDRIEKDVTASNPDIIGISLMETQLKYAGAFLKRLRGYYKGFVICGGPYPTMDPDGCLGMEGVDAVCVGEGEDAVERLAEALASGSDYKEINNLWFKLPDGTIAKNKLRPFADLDKLPAEDKEIFDLEKILPLKNYQLEAMLGRGCVYRCSYCINRSYLDKYRQFCERPVTVKDYVRVKDAAVAITEIKETISRHPKIKKIAFIDDNFIMYDKFLEDFFTRYKKEISLPFMCNVNPASYSVSKAKLLKEAGCDDIRFGIESGSERVKRQVLKRNIPNKSVVEAFKINNGLNIMTSSFNMIGLPTEDREEIFETLKLNAAIKPDTVKLMTFYPFRNTPIYGVCEELGLIDYDKKLELDNYDTFSCLKFPPEHYLFLRKVQTAFNWYINVFLDNGASSEYDKMVKHIEDLSPERWDDFDFYSADEEMSRNMRRKGLAHYSKFINRSLAVKFPSRHFDKQ